MLTTGLFVFFKNPSARLNRLFFGCALSLAVWTLGYSLMYTTADPLNALIFARLGYVGIVFIPTFFVHFVLEFLHIRRPRMIQAAYGCSFIFLILSRFKIFIPGIYTYFWGYYPQAGPLYGAFVLYFYACCGLCVVVLLKAYRELRLTQGSRTTLNQVKYVLLAFFVASLSVSDYLPNYHIGVYPFAYLVAFGWLLLMAYAIFKYGVMDIDVFIRKTVIYFAVTASLTGVYVVVVMILARMFEGIWKSFSLLPSVGAAYVMTFLFHPLTVRMQRWIDRQFPRERLDPDLLREAAGGFAHEMKRPLSKISLPAQLALLDIERLMRGNTSADAVLPAVAERLRYIIGQSGDAALMIEAIRELSQLNDAPLEELNLVCAVQSVVAGEQEFLVRHQVEVIANISPHVPLVLARAKQIHIVILNLLKNAVESLANLKAGEARRIDIQAEDSPNRVFLRMTDNGPGIAPEDAAKLFQPLYSTKGARGTGMGLYLSKQIMQTHGGDLELYPSASGRGACLQMTFPKARKRG